METEETAKFSGAEEQSTYIARQKIADPEDPYLLNPLGSNDWLFPPDFALSPGLLTDLEIPGNIETFFNIRSSF